MVLTATRTEMTETGINEAMDTLPEVFMVGNKGLKSLIEGALSQKQISLLMFLDSASLIISMLVVAMSMAMLDLIQIIMTELLVILAALYPICLQQIRAAT